MYLLSQALTLGVVCWLALLQLEEAEGSQQFLEQLFENVMKKLGGGEGWGQQMRKGWGQSEPRKKRWGVINQLSCTQVILLKVQWGGMYPNDPF